MTAPPAGWMRSSSNKHTLSSRMWAPSCMVKSPCRLTLYICTFGAQLFQMRRPIKTCMKRTLPAWRTERWDYILQLFLIDSNNGNNVGVLCLRKIDDMLHCVLWRHVALTTR